MNNFVILTDTRQKVESHILKEFDEQGILHIRTGLPTADYMALRYDDKRGFYLDYLMLIDTKKDLLEMCNNMCRTSEHDRLVREVERAHKLGTKEFIFLIGEKGIKTVDDIKNWKNKRTKVKGETLYKIMSTFKEHHGCRFIICDKKDLGKKIIQLLNESEMK